MRAVLIGAGRGARLAPHTDTGPKTLVPVLGRPMLAWILEALTGAGLTARDVVFVGGYRLDAVRTLHPDFTFVENHAWEHNNVLQSLLCARDWLGDGFLCSYTDIVYRAEIVTQLLASPHDITLACDTDWRRRYLGRTRHPESDAEKVIASGDRVEHVARTIPAEAATGEFLGVAKFSRRGAAQLLAAFDQASATAADNPAALFCDQRTFARAYLIDLLPRMIAQGVAVHQVTTHGGYMEIDTGEDLALAPSWWHATSTP